MRMQLRGEYNRRSAVKHCVKPAKVAVFGQVGKALQKGCPVDVAVGYAGPLFQDAVPEHDGIAFFDDADAERHLVKQAGFEGKVGCWFHRVSCFFEMRVIMALSTSVLSSRKITRI